MFNTRTQLGQHLQSLAEKTLSTMSQREVKAIFDKETEELGAAVIAILRAAAEPDDSLSADAVFAGSFLKDRGVNVVIESAKNKEVIVTEGDAKLWYHMRRIIQSIELETEDVIVDRLKAEKNKIFAAFNNKLMSMIPDEYQTEPRDWLKDDIWLKEIGIEIIFTPAMEGDEK